MLNILIPMAGQGSRFSMEGYSMPKLLIPIHGKPMVQLVIENLRTTEDCRFIFLVLRQHLEQHDLVRRLQTWAPGAQIVPVERTTEGAACTVLLAKDLIDTSAPLLIANSDQWVDVSIDDFLAASRTWDGMVMTMTAHTPEWSYVKTGKDGLVTDVAEKKVISSDATVGIYHFQQGHDFVEAALRMVSAEDRVNGEYYVAPVYKYLLQAGKRVGTYPVGAPGNGMYGLGTPRQLEEFLKLPISIRAAGFHENHRA